MKKFFEWLSVLVIAGCMVVGGVACGHGGVTAPKDSVDATKVVSPADESGLNNASGRPTMGEFVGVTVPDVPTWDVRAVGPVPVVVARTMREPTCGAFIVVMSRPGSASDGAWIAQMIDGASELPAVDGTAIELERLPDGYLFGRTTTNGMVAWVAYRSLKGSQGSVLVRIAGRWAPRCGDEPEKIFKMVAHGIVAN